MAFFCCIWKILYAKKHCFVKLQVKFVSTREHQPQAPWSAKDNQRKANVISKLKSFDFYAKTNGKKKCSIEPDDSLSHRAQRELQVILFALHERIRSKKIKNALISQNHLNETWLLVAAVCGTNSSSLHLGRWSTAWWRQWCRRRPTAGSAGPAIRRPWGPPRRHAPARPRAPPAGQLLPRPRRLPLVACGRAETSLGCCLCFSAASAPPGWPEESHLRQRCSSSPQRRARRRRRGGSRTRGPRCRTGWARGWRGAWRTRCNRHDTHLGSKLRSRSHLSRSSVVYIIQITIQTSRARRRRHRSQPASLSLLFLLTFLLSQVSPFKVTDRPPTAIHNWAN